MYSQTTKYITASHSLSEVAYSGKGHVKVYEKLRSKKMQVSKF